MNSVEETAQRLREFFEAAMRKSTEPAFEAAVEPFSPREQLKPAILRVYEQCVSKLAPGEPAELDRLMRKMFAEYL